MEAEGFNFFEHLPHELLIHLFSTFDHICLTKCAQICQEWRELASSNSFWLQLSQERFICPNKTLENSESEFWRLFFRQKYQFWQKHRRAIQVGVAELKLLLDNDLDAAPCWRNGRNSSNTSTLRRKAPSIETWRRELPTLGDNYWPKGYSTWQEVESQLLDQDQVDPIDSELRASMRVAMKSSIIVDDAGFDTLVTLLERPELRRSWDIILEHGHVLCDIDKNTDIALLIYSNVDCCLVRRREVTLQQQRRIYTLSEQSAPYSDDLVAMSAAVTVNHEAYQAEAGAVVAVWGSGFRVEELTPGGPCRVSYVVQVVPDPSQLMFADELVRDMELHRSHCLTMLSRAAERYKQSGLAN